MKWIFPILFLFAAACTSGPEQAPVVQDQLEGNWLLSEATRNGKKISTLENSYFTFREKELETNWLGQSSKVPFVLNDKEISTENQNITYKIVELDDSNLKLSTVYRNFAFTFLLKKDTIEN